MQGDNLTFDLSAHGIETEFIEAGGLRFETLTSGDPDSDRPRGRAHPVQKLPVVFDLERL